MMAESKLETEIGNIATHILGLVAKDEQSAVAKAELHSDLTRAREAIKKLQPSDFQHQIGYPHELLSRGLLNEAFPENSRLKFLFTQYQFVENHFGKVYVRAEGYSCYMDKTRSVLRLLASHLAKGTMIKFSDPEGYWVPQTVLKDHDGILEFYEAITALYYGNGDLYVDLIAKFPRKQP